MQQKALAWRIEDVCFNSWPALKEVFYAGWVARFGEGLNRRTDSANPLQAEFGNIDAIVETCEVLYLSQGRQSVFRIPSLIDGAIEKRLLNSGYVPNLPSLVLYADIKDAAAEKNKDIILLTAPSPEWFEAMSILQNHTEQEGATYRRIVGAIVIRAGYAILRLDGQIAALAYATLSDGLLCIESVITTPSFRGKGCGRRLLTYLIAWGKVNGAKGVCLQVAETNEAARTLYKNVGLKTSFYRYQYLCKPLSNE